MEKRFTFRSPWFLSYWCSCLLLKGRAQKHCTFNLLKCYHDHLKMLLIGKIDFWTRFPTRQILTRRAGRHPGASVLDESGVRIKNRLFLQIWPFKHYHVSCFCHVCCPSVNKVQLHILLVFYTWCCSCWLLFLCNFKGSVHTNHEGMRTLCFLSTSVFYLLFYSQLSILSYIVFGVLFYIERLFAVFPTIFFTCMWETVERWQETGDSCMPQTSKPR